MYSPMSKVNEMSSTNMTNYLTNYKAWAPVMYNVAAYGIVGDGIKDNTVAVQKLINFAISENRKAIFFQPGIYLINDLENADQVVFFGDNATVVGSFNGIISQIGGWTTDEYVNTLFASVGNANPKGVYSTLADLQNAYPEGATGIFITSDNGEWYYWNETEWTSGGMFMNVPLPDGSIGAIKTDFVEVSPNLFNKHEIVQGFDINITTGAIISDASRTLTGFIQVSSASVYTLSHAAKVGFYDGNYTFISGASGTSINTSTALYIRLSVPSTTVNQFQLYKGNVPITDYHEYGLLTIPGLRVHTNNLGDDVKSSIAASNQRLDNHITSTQAHNAASITYSGSVAVQNVKDAIDKTNQNIEKTNQRVSDIVAHNGDGTKDTELIDSRGSYTVLGDRLDVFESQITDNTNRLNMITAEKQMHPIQHYGFRQIYVPFPDSEYSVASDITFADDRDGDTGKLWAMYFDSSIGHVRMEVPYVGCSRFELGEPIPMNTSGGQLNHAVKIDDIWYISTGPYVWAFYSGLEGDATQLSIISQVGQNGDQAFLFNSCIDKHPNGTWYAWYSTFNGTAVGIRRATAPAPTGPWTIEPGFWMLGSDIDTSLNWARVYYVMSDKWGRKWAVAGAGRKWAGIEWPDNDDAASVWVAPITDISTKPNNWQCIADLPYFTAVPYGSQAYNNAYAPSFLQDGDEWYLYVNSGRYGKEQIIELKYDLSQSWTTQQAEAADYYLGATLYPIEWSRAFIRDGTFKVSFNGLMLSYYENPQIHSIFFRMKDAKSGEIFAERLLQNGTIAWESRQFELTAIISAYVDRLIVVEAMYSVGAGQVEPAEYTSRLRATTLAIEKIS